MSKKTQQSVTAYKAFDADLLCRGHKFEVGRTYTIKGKPVLCNRGFHACENPLDVLNYYDLCGSRFARVTVSGEIAREGNGDKICGTSITVDAELSLSEWIGEAVKCLMTSCKSGDDVQAASGNYSQLAASGDYSQLAASGYYSQLAASGHYSKLAASGNCSQLAASGNYSKLAASGYYSKLAASGNCSKLAASGNCSQLAASGYYSKLAASGNCSKLAASGHYSKLVINGDKSAAAAVGQSSEVKAVAGTPVAICEYSDDGAPIGFVTGIAGKDFPADTWVKAQGGKLVPVEI